MCRAMEEMRAEAVHDNNIEIATMMLDSGKLTIEEAAQFFKLPIDEVKELAKNKACK